MNLNIATIFQPCLLCPLCCMVLNWGGFCMYLGAEPAHCIWQPGWRVLKSYKSIYSTNIINLINIINISVKREVLTERAVSSSDHMFRCLKAWSESDRWDELILVSRIQLLTAQLHSFCWTDGIHFLLFPIIVFGAVLLCFYLGPVPKENPLPGCIVILSFKLWQAVFSFLFHLMFGNKLFLNVQSDESNSVGLHCRVCSIEKGSISCFQREEKINSDHRHHWVLREKVKISMKKMIRLI